MSEIESDAAPIVHEDTQASALQFLRWAHSRGLLAAEAYYPGDSFGLLSTPAVVQFRLATTAKPELSDAWCETLWVSSLG